MSNQIYSNKTKLYSQTASYILNGTQSIVSGADQFILFSEDHNNIRGLSYAPATGTFTCEEDMVLQIATTVEFDANAVGQRGLDINFGAERVGCVRLDTAAVGTARLSTSGIGNTEGVFPLVWDIRCFQNSGGPININGPVSILKISRIG